MGQAIAAVLGAHGREDGCFIGNGYIVSWCFGHLAELTEDMSFSMESVAVKEGKTTPPKRYTEDVCYKG